MAAAASIPGLAARHDDPEDDDAFENCFPKVESTFAKIDSSLRILQQICSAHVELSPLFLHPLYKNTSLDRIPFVGGVSRDCDDSHLRKNLYFLASEVQNSINLIIQLVQRGVLTLDEKDGIMRHEGEGDQMKSLVTFIYVVKKDTVMFPKFLEALTVTHNEKIATMLQDANAKRNPNPVPKPKGHAPPPPAQPPLLNAGVQQAANPGPEPHIEVEAHALELEHEKWECAFCTYMNSSLGNVCEICYKTKDFKVTPANSTLVCPKCTLINPMGVNVCTICNFEIVPKPQPQILPLPHPVEEDSWDED